MTDRLYRSRDDRMLAGVAGGVAEMLDVDPSLVRIVWALLIILTGGIALVLYIIMAFVVPEAPDGYVHASRSTTDAVSTPIQPSPGGWVAPDGSVVPMAAPPSPEEIAAQRARRRDRDRTGGLIAGVVLIVIGGFFFIRQFIPAIDPGLWWPVVAIITGVLLIVLAVVPSRRPAG